MSNALASELVAAAQKTLAQAQAGYPRQAPVISGLQPTNRFNVSCGTFPQDAPAAQQFTAAVWWSMNAAQAAAQQAVEACTYIASYNPSAAQYVAAATQFLTQLQGGPYSCGSPSQNNPNCQPGGYLVWALGQDWSNCSNTNGGQCDAGAISCQPGSDWITYTLLVLQSAQMAVSMATQALAAPVPPPPPTRYKMSRHPPHGLSGCGGCGGGSLTGSRTLDFVLSHSGRAMPGFDVGVGAAAKPCTATSFAQASNDFQNVIMEALIAGDTYYGEDKKNMLLDYTDAVTAYQAAGQAGATCIGPEIDSVGYASVTSTFTGQAWTINKTLATLPKSGAPDPSSNMPSPYYTQADADKAKQLARQMGDLYQQALDAGSAAAPVNPSQPTSQTVAVPPSNFWPAVALVTVAGAVGTALVMSSKTRRPAHA